METNMYKLTHPPKPCKVAPKDCEGFLLLNNFPGQRALNEAKAKRYSELLIQGKLRPVDIAFATCPDGNRYLMNGQHVSQGCVWANKEMNAVLSYYKCETWSDAWQLMATFDVHASRTQGQIFNAARGLFKNEGLRDVPLRVLSSCGTALACMSNGSVSFHRHSKTADKTTKPLLVEQHATDVLWVARFADSNAMMRVGCVAAMIGTHRKNPAKADEFWSKIHDGLGFKSKTEPQKKVFDYLSRTTGNAQNNSRTHHDAVYATCVAWWNAFITGEDRTIVKVGAMGELPKIKG